MEKKLTDEEIVKALECCIKGVNFSECVECPLDMIDEDCCIYNPTLIDRYALDLINRQKAEIERLTEYNANLNGMCLEFIDKNTELQNRVDELKKRLIDEFYASKVEACVKAKKKAVKDTAKEILTAICEVKKVAVVEKDFDRLIEWLKERYGVEGKNERFQGIC